MQESLYEWLTAQFDILIAATLVGLFLVALSISGRVNTVVAKQDAAAEALRNYAKFNEYDGVQASSDSLIGALNEIDPVTQTMFIKIGTSEFYYGDPYKDKGRVTKTYTEMLNVLMTNYTNQYSVALVYDNDQDTTDDMIRSGTFKLPDYETQNEVTGVSALYN